MDENEYVCTLDEESIQKAKVELNEDPKERLGAVQTLRDWVNDQKWLKTPTDTKFLLSFLRHRKFSQLEARALLERYWKARTNNPQWYEGFDPADEQYIKILKQCTYVPIPTRDKNGRTIMFGRVGKCDTSGKSYDPDQYFRTFMILFDCLLLDENTQVNGFVFLEDWEEVSVKLLPFFGLERMKKSDECFQKALPARYKQANLVNTGPVFEGIWNIFKPLTSEKLKSRICFHRNIASVYKNIDMSLMPDEYLPDDYEGPSSGSFEDMMDVFINEKLKKPENLAFLRRLYNSSYGVDLSQKPTDDTPQASFRKLNVD